MSVNNNPIDYTNYKFQRDTKINYQTGDTVLNSLFKIWDTDGNGIRNSADNSVVSHYAKQTQKISQRLNVMSMRFQSISQTDYFAQFCEFTNKRGISLTCVKNKSEIPKGAKQFDISSFEIGDEEKEILKFGYVEGWKNLSEDDKNKFIELYNQSVTMLTALKKLE